MGEEGLPPRQGRFIAELDGGASALGLLRWGPSGYSNPSSYSTHRRCMRPASVQSWKRVGWRKGQVRGQRPRGESCPLGWGRAQGGGCLGASWGLDMEGGLSGRAEGATGPESHLRSSLQAESGWKSLGQRLEQWTVGKGNKTRTGAAVMQRKAKEMV